MGPWRHACDLAGRHQWAERPTLGPTWLLNQPLKLQLTAPTAAAVIFRSVQFSRSLAGGSRRDERGDNRTWNWNSFCHQPDRSIGVSVGSSSSSGSSSMWWFGDRRNHNKATTFHRTIGSSFEAVCSPDSLSMNPLLLSNSSMHYPNSKGWLTDWLNGKLLSNQEGRRRRRRRRRKCLAGGAEAAIAWRGCFDQRSGDKGAAAPRGKRKISQHPSPGYCRRRRRAATQPPTATSTTAFQLPADLSRLPAAVLRWLLLLFSASRQRTNGLLFPLHT